MQARCKASWLETLMEAVVKSNRDAAVVLQQHGLTALTDVTGFGLAGHMLEMLKSSNVSAEIRLNDIPLYPGVEELISDGIESTLAPANRDAEREINIRDEGRTTPHYATLFDPQTCGGLLAGVSADQATAAIAALQAEGIPAVDIGTVIEYNPSRQYIFIS